MTRIAAVEPLPGYQLKVRFDDGATGVFAVDPQHRGGVFLNLLDISVFNRVTINPEFGCVEWPGGIDLCPDVMYEAVTGRQHSGKSQNELLLRDKSKSSD
jgi:hypothetical protein